MTGGYQLKLESIGDDSRAKLKLARSRKLKLDTRDLCRCLDLQRMAPFVAEAVSYHRHLGVQWVYLTGNKSYLESNSVGSRGVYLYYNLRQGKFYHIREPVSWKKAREYFAWVYNGEIFEVTEEDIIKCLA